MLANHRRTLLYTAGMMLVTAAVFIGVGRHPPSGAPATSFDAIGRLDLQVFDAAEGIRNVVLSGFARVLNVIGGGVFTIPFRAILALWLAARRRWRAFTVWALTWITAEVVVVAAKAFFHRGRPPDPLVSTSGYSFPSGHAVAVAATAAALVLVLMPSGSRRRKWEAIAVGFALFMALSRVYLNAHWLSDVYAGVLLGAGIALAWAAVVTEIRDTLVRRRGPPSRHAHLGPPTPA